MPSNILHLAPWWLSSMSVPFFIYFPQNLWVQDHIFTLISAAVNYSVIVCMGQDTVFIYIIICICYASFYICSFWYVHHTKLHNHNHNQNLLPCPKGPVLLIWCSSRTDPNIMHFPSPENLHTAQQTDKYLIGQPSVPSPHGSSYSGHESTTGCECHVSLWESKPMRGQSLPCSPANASPAGAGGRLFAWLQAPHRCQGITDE